MSFRAERPSVSQSVPCRMKRLRNGTHVDTQGQGAPIPPFSPLPLHSRRLRPLWSSPSLCSSFLAFLLPLNTMGLCKCMNITDLFCFVHKKAVCQGCVCPEHKVVRPLARVAVGRKSWSTNWWCVVPHRNLRGMASGSRVRAARVSHLQGPHHLRQRPTAHLPTYMGPLPPHHLSLPKKVPRWSMWDTH